MQSSSLASCYSRWLGFWSISFTISRPCQVQEPIYSSYRYLAVSDAVLSKKCKCLTINNGSIELKCTHSYYYQIQLAMFCTRTKWCNFFFRTTVDFHCERISFDESLCGSILPILRRFYILAILPELTLKAKPIWEPKDWVAEETVFLQEIIGFMSWAHTWGNVESAYTIK